MRPLNAHDDDDDDQGEINNLIMIPKLHWSNKSEFYGTENGRVAEGSSMTIIFMGHNNTYGNKNNKYFLLNLVNFVAFPPLPQENIAQ